MEGKISKKLIGAGDYRSAESGGSHRASLGMAKKLCKIGVAVVLAVAVILTLQIFFAVDEHEQVVITQFGEYIRTINKPGLAMKLPFIQAVARFDRRVLATDAPQAEYLSQDKKRLVADPVTRWRIADPLKFYKTVRDEAGARARLGRSPRQTRMTPREVRGSRFQQRRLYVGSPSSSNVKKGRID